MKTLSPAHAAAALVLLLTGAAAAADGRITTTTTTTRPSTVTAGTSSIGTPAPSSTTATAGATSGTGTSTADTTTTTTSSTILESTPNVPSQATFGRDTGFANDSGNHALGTSPGQTSSGTLAGNSTIGIPAGAESLGTGATTATTTQAGTVLGGTGGVVGSAGAVLVPSQPSSQVAVNVNPSSAPGNRTPTPTYDAAARRGQSQVERQARSGRVTSQAPRTDNDRTDQMPDDRIIRY